MHTTYSDGRLTPEKLVAAAKEAHLNYIAITDHDTVDGIRHLYEQNIYPSKTINIIPGIEFSCEVDGHDVHILGYDFDIYNQDMADKVNEIAESRWARLSVMIKKINELGYDISEGDVLEIAGSSSSIGRLHVARALVNKKIFSTMHEVFDTLREHGKPAYIPHYRIEPEEAVALIRRAGGKSVLAHPKLIKDDALVEKVLSLGFDGLEVFYPKHDATETAKYIRMAEKYGLMLTGGSDYHALSSRYPENLGEFTIEDKYAIPFFNPPESLE